MMGAFGRFGHAHYVLNVLLISSYGVARITRTSAKLAEKEEWLGLTRVQSGTTHDRLLLLTLIFLVVPYPKYAGPHKSTTLTGAFFNEHVRNGSSGTWLVYLHADWCDECLYHDAMFADLSLAHGTDAVRFGRLDVEAYPDIAKELNIDMNATTTKQLPSLVLFEGGKETKRLPRFDHTGAVVRTKLDLTGVAVYFGFQGLPHKKHK
ncbi:hypothetical protein DYB25_007414 [Aphanomyces astaci]|uniref:Thioredoxin domain-containing protein n=1 Tax=Aphanomyces astaci TaxID=112090 RepID=A0A397C966_APHAT|nr:hypothetical protein DYB36_007183 [Aphanomyces astaci]RHY23626.1 hypothetical protein DYB25_007414 [Aphanomyces astaci]RHY39282.1 hypothetical protein DYB34_005034 [Aphanomyces astaci]RHY41797.1 hypothetical protein DYB30_008814 [Aphanomyces astaci]RHZ24556.1 hypothetical protein DYB26_005884 [Aphanomyces astaci]